MGRGRGRNGVGVDVHAAEPRARHPRGHAAGDVAAGVAGAGFRGVYVDANAVSPATAAHVGDVVTGTGASFVDGDLIGGPARLSGGPRLYLSGERAGDVASL